MVAAKTAPNSIKCGCVGALSAAASIALTAKIRTGAAKGKTSTATNTPARRAPTAKAAPTAPIKLNAGVAINTATMVTQNVAGGKFRNTAKVC